MTIGHHPPYRESRINYNTYTGFPLKITVGGDTGIDNVGY